MSDDTIPNPSDLVLQWGNLGQAAAAGELQLADGVAERCAQHCDSFIEKLIELRDEAYKLTVWGSFGTLPSGIAVAEKLSLLAVGGEYSMVQALTDHIAVVTEMKAMFLQIGASYAATEDANAAAVNSIESEL